MRIAIFVAEYKNEKEYQEIDEDYPPARPALAKKLIDRLGLKSPYLEGPQTANVEISKLCVRDGRLESVNLCTHPIMLPRAEMTEDDYYSEVNRHIADIPPCFREVVTNIAWQNGGEKFEDCLNLAAEVAYQLKTTLTDLEHRISKSTREELWSINPKKQKSPTSKKPQKPKK